MVERSDEIGELAKALAAAQAELTHADKDAVNPGFKSRYATLASCVEAAKPLHRHGLCYVQAPEPAEGGIQIRTVLMHASGQWIAGTLYLPAAQNTAQAYGSAITYARRYGLCSMIGVAPDDDDDANAASAPANQQQRAASVPRTNGAARPPAPPQVPTPAPTADPATADARRGFRDALVGFGWDAEWIKSAQNMASLITELAPALAGRDTRAYTAMDWTALETMLRERIVAHLSDDFADDLPGQPTTTGAVV